MDAARLPNAESLLVAYSGGKDSLATLDLCVRSGKRVEAFFMYFVPGMDYTQFWCEYAEKRFGVKVHRTQHPIASNYLKTGTFCVGHPDLKLIKAKDVENQMRAKTGIEWVGYGYKLADSPSRRAYLTFMAAWCSCCRKSNACDCAGRKIGDGFQGDGICSSLKRFTPLATWRDRDVMAYLSSRKIAIPGMSHRRVNGLALIPDVMYQFRRDWPADYRRILKFFPFAAGQADRFQPPTGPGGPSSPGTEAGVGYGAPSQSDLATMEMATT